MTLPLASTPFLEWISGHGYLLLPPAALFGGAAASVAAGFLCGQGYWRALPVLAILWVGEAVGDCLYYLLGRIFGRAAAPSRWLRRAGLTPERLRFAETQFSNRGVTLLALGKLSHGLGIAFLTAAGAAGMPFVRFLLINLAVGLPKAAALFYLGRRMGETFGDFTRGMKYVDAGFWAMALLLVAGVAAGRAARKKLRDKNAML